MRQSVILFFVISFCFSRSFFGEEVIWNVAPGGSSTGLVPDALITGLGPGGSLASADYMVGQIFVQCAPGVPRIGFPGTINKVITFFENDGPGFDTFAEANLNSETGNLEIVGLARLNVFQVGNNGTLPEPFQNPDAGPVVEVTFIENLMNQSVEVRAAEIRNQLAQDIIIQPNIRYFIGLTPFLFPLSNGLPFDGIHLTNPNGIGNEFQSAIRQTVPQFDKAWRPAGDEFKPPNPLFATIQINGAPLFLLGDANMDGNLNLLDVDPFIAILGSGKFAKEVDINGDGSVDLLDVDGFIEILANGS